MQSDQTCMHCGQVIPWGQAACPVCKEKGSFLWNLRRDTFLFLTFLGLIVLFVVTGFAARYYHAKERALADEWYNRGGVDLRAGNTDSALEDFRSALVYSRDNSLYRLRLAQALVAANRIGEARTHLLTLWEREPGNGTVNLELARLVVREGSVPDALRYYHQAIYGVWEADPEQHRREARLELCGFLLGRGSKAQAQAELIALAAELPQVASLHTQVGALFMRAGDYDRALRQFRDALRLDQREQAALAGAGEAAFQLEDYQQARRYLDRAVRIHPDDAQSAQLLDTSNLVLSIDPFERVLAQDERERRVLRSFGQALARLRACTEERGARLENPVHQADLQSLSDRLQRLRTKMSPRFLRRNPDQIEPAMDIVFAAEELTARECGPATGLDQALWLIERKHKGAEQ